MTNLLIGSTVKGIPGEIISSFVVIIIGLIVGLIVFFKAKKVDPLKKPKGIMIVMEMAVEKVDGMVNEMMGPHFIKFAPYIMTLCFYIFVCFIIGLIGLPSPMTNVLVPLSISLITFLLIHITSMKYKKWGYFHRYIDPFAVFLPINLLSMWAPLLSLTFRLFGNAISGWVLMSIVYWALENLSTLIFGLPYFVAPVIAPALHLYFDLFSGFIQTTVFVMLTMLLIAQEGPSKEELVAQRTVALNN